MNAISPDHERLSSIAAETIQGGYVVSAAIFEVDRVSGELELAAAAGIAGPPLDALVVAVKNPEHPVTRTLADAEPTFDVEPMAPGGPALRSHLPLRPTDDRGLAALGVLAVAHDQVLSQAQRAALIALAADAAAVIANGASQP